MKTRITKQLLLTGVLCFLLIAAGRSQGDSVTAPAPEAPEEVVNLRYYSTNNNMQYLLLECRLKTGKTFTPMANKTFQVYMDSADAALLVARLTTNASGLAKTFIPPTLKTAWDAGATHNFMAVVPGKEEAATELAVTKAKLEMDTAGETGTRTITVKLLKMNGTEWQPVPDAEMKIGVQRLGGILSGGEEETYTTDSSGTVSVSFTRDSIPGDAKGNIVLAARVEGHDELGNLLLEQVVPWGKPAVVQTDFFDQRTLWSTRFKTPFWLLFMAYGIVIGVWGTLIYLVVQLFKIKKLGRSAGSAAG